MKLTSFYFTGTGNTKYISDHLVEIMQKRGLDARSVSIVEFNNDEKEALIQSSDILFFAYPIYGSDIPENMKRFIEDLPQAHGKKTGVICTQLFFSGDGASIYYRKLKAKGYDQHWGYQINMPNNLCIPSSPLFQSNDYTVHEEKHLRKARQKLEKIADHILTEQYHHKDKTIIHKFLAQSQRPWFRWFVLDSYKNALDINQEKCISCGMCVASCPNQVIEMQEGVVSFENRDICTSCLRCLNFCPTDAITFNGKNRFPHYKGPTKDLYHSLFSK